MLHFGHVTKCYLNAFKVSSLMMSNVSSEGAGSASQAGLSGHPKAARLITACRRHTPNIRKTMKQTVHSSLG